jgi:hypothetical protein
MIQNFSAIVQRAINPASFPRRRPPRFLPQKATIRHAQLSADARERWRKLHTACSEIQARGIIALQRSVVQIVIRL